MERFCESDSWNNGDYEEEVNGEGKSEGEGDFKFQI
jgi:hypothetical protein